MYKHFYATHVNGLDRIQEQVTERLTEIPYQYRADRLACDEIESVVLLSQLSKVD